MNLCTSPRPITGRRPNVIVCRASTPKGTEARQTVKLTPISSDASQRPNGPIRKRPLRRNEAKPPAYPFIIPMRSMSKPADARPWFPKEPRRPRCARFHRRVPVTRTSSAAVRGYLGGASASRKSEMRRPRAFRPASFAAGRQNRSRASARAGVGTRPAALWRRISAAVAATVAWRCADAGCVDSSPPPPASAGRANTRAPRSGS